MSKWIILFFPECKTEIVNSQYYFYRCKHWKSHSIWILQVYKNNPVLINTNCAFAEELLILSVDRKQMEGKTKLDPSAHCILKHFSTLAQKYSLPVLKNKQVNIKLTSCCWKVTVLQSLRDPGSQNLQFAALPTITTKRDVRSQPCSSAISVSHTPTSYLRWSLKWETHTHTHS